MAKRLLIGAVLALAVLAFTFLGAERQEVPVTGRAQRVALSDQQQQQLGAQVYGETLEQERAAVVTSGPQFAQVQRVARRLSRIGASYKPTSSGNSRCCSATKPTRSACPAARSSCSRGCSTSRRHHPQARRSRGAGSA